jgi:uncharacterized cupin superfamily protein
MSLIERIATGPVTPLADPVPPEKVVTGAPVTGLRSVHEDEGRGFYAGIWESTEGSWTVTYTEDEVCVLLSGRIRLTGEASEPMEFSAGDAFIIRRGFSGLWETLEPARKVYTILL